MVEIKIRPANLKDLPELEKIEKNSFTYPYPKNLLKTLMLIRFGVFLVAVVEEKIVGYISSIYETKNTATIASIAVHPTYRGKNIAKKLLKTLLEILKRKNISEVRLEVRKSNLLAQNLYKSFGFKTVCTLKSYYEDGEDAVVMYLSLKNS